MTKQASIIAVKLTPSYIIFISNLEFITMVKDMKSTLTNILRLFANPKGGTK